MSYDTDDAITIIVRPQRQALDLPVARSEARRLLHGAEAFTVVEWDFAGVEMLGQGFADKMFRVFAHAHPGIELRVVNANSTVRHMIRHVAGHRAVAILGDEEAP